MMAKATRRPWRTKLKRQQRELLKKKPGSGVSIDQMTTTTPSYVAQMKGIPTKHRYTAATIFVDQTTRYTYVHLQFSTSADDTIEVKRCFEEHMASLGHKVEHYQADNGIFADNKWRAAILLKYNVCPSQE